MSARDHIQSGSFLVLSALAVLCSGLSVQAADPILENIERTIRREPQYSSQPKYVLLAFGKQAESQVWVVDDGRHLYVDRNGNGDLTDDGAPLTPTDERSFNLSSPIPSWDYNYLLDALTTSNGQTQVDFDMRKWNYDEAEEDRYGLSLTLNDLVPMYAGWFSFMSSTAESASIVHFGGALHPKPLRNKELVLGSKVDRFSVAFVNPGLGDGGASRLSIDAFPADQHPVAEIDWPVPAGAAPLKTTHHLTERCCYWEFYTTRFEIPDEAIAGTAKVRVSLPVGFVPIPLSRDDFEMPVRAATRND